ncbi:GTP-binding protein [Candidatus Kaiserbacteria bacterium]|nr:GTP-binding protein [Candidatus Kaiserbacteria bacterium]
MSGTSNICKQPVVAIVGHIDHGKTTLLDYIRKSSVAAKETGGITQRVSAYEIVHPSTSSGQAQASEDRAITFIDTPGHEAFQKMRERAGAAADIAILIVAADDGVKPQTLEAHKAIMAAKIPYIVAFTKVDKDTANLERAKESVMREEIYLEGLGGEVPYVAVSGKTGDGVPELLDLIILVSDLHNISCDAGKAAEGVVLESTRDPRSGTSATVIIKQGTLTVGGFAVSGSAYASLRAIEDFTGAKVKTISCGKPARITGFTEEPKVGALLSVVGTKKEAEELCLKNKKPIVASERKAVETENDERVTIRIILKADTAGSLEALEYEVGKISEERVELFVVAKSVGTINENDIKPLMGFSPAIVLGFNVKTEPSAKDLAERQRISIETRSIIYELSDWLKAEMQRLKPESSADAVTGGAQIIRHFSTAGSKHVVGGKVTEGTLKLHDRVIVMRRGIEVGPGRIVNLQMQRSDVDSVPESMEFGAQIETKADVVAGDLLVASPHKAAAPR